MTELLAQSRWSAAVTTYNKFRTRFGSGSSGMIPDQDWHGVGTRTVEDDIHAMLDLYCKHLQAKVIDQNRTASQLAAGTSFYDFPHTCTYFIYRVWIRLAIRAIWTQTSDI